MKSVLLNNAGYTADGQWRLVVVDPKPEMSAKGLCVSESEHDPAGVYRAMIAASPAPVLAEAVPVRWLVKYSGNDYCETLDDERKVKQLVKELESCGWLDIRVEPLFTAPPAPAMPADANKLIAQGRAEAMALLLKVNPDGMDDYIDGIGGNGDYGLSWNHKKLKALLKVDGEIWSLVSAADEKASYWFSALHELVCEAKQGLCPPNLCGYGKGQKCCQESRINAIKEAEQLLDQPINSTTKDKRIAKLEAENQALRADAGRYRWLRDKGLQGSFVELTSDLDGKGYVNYSMSFSLPEFAGSNYEDKEWSATDIDAAIDAAKGGV